MYVLPVTTASVEHSFSFLCLFENVPLNDHECAKTESPNDLFVHGNCAESLNV